MKRAIVAGELALIIIAILIGVIVLSATMSAGEGVESTTKDTLCKLTNAAKGKVPVGKLFVPNFCGQANAVVEADDWSKCAKEYGDEKDLKSCAAHQVAKLAERCWDMYGRGQTDASTVGWDYDCFKITIHDLPPNQLITEAVLTRVMYEQGLCNELPNSDCDSDCKFNGRCGSSDKIYWKESYYKGVPPQRYTEGIKSGWKIKFHDDVWATPGGEDQIVFTATD